MKWVFVCVFVCLASYGEGGALRCTPGLQDTSCTTEELEKDLQVEQLIDSRKDAKETAAVEAECLAGSEWESNCHSCRCSETGAAICLRRSDCIQEVTGEPLKCKPNTTFVRECNTCVCLDNGLGLCTLETCRRSTIPKKSDLKPGKECAPGTFWNSQCNSCGCSPDGDYHCTKKDCPDQGSEPVMRCAPDTMWNNDCNTCWCTSDGRAMCTKMGCDNDVSFDANPGSEIQTSPEIDQEVSEKHEYYIEDTEHYKYNTDVTGSVEINENREEVKHSYETSDDLELPDLSIEEDANILGEGNNSGTTKQYHSVLKRSVCKPSQAFQSECNTCKCSADGQRYTCTQNECMEDDKNKEVEVFMENEGEDHIERHSVCKPRGTFYIGCNTCHCNNFGTDYSCTNKPCPLPEDVELFHELRPTKSSKNKSGQKIVCVANRMFIMDCNTCWCNDDGTSYFCTRRVCVSELPEDGSNEDRPEDLRVIKRECRPDEVFELDCNMCRCNPDGKSFSCTRRACVEPVDEEAKNTSLTRRKRGVAQELPKTCQPGQEFRMDCNKCLCDNEGQDFSCTRHDCTAMSNGNGGPRIKRDTSEQVAMECSPGSVFDKDCNVCRCTQDGLHATCTLKRCTKPEANKKDKDVNERVPDTDLNFRCNPGEQFKQGCNDCSCSADGKSVFCTVRYCDQDITPPPSV